MSYNKIKELGVVVWLRDLPKHNGGAQHWPMIFKKTNTNRSVSNE